RRFPADKVARHAQYPSRVAERFISLQAVLLGNTAILHRDLAVLHDLQRDLVLDLLDAETRCCLVLDNEGLHLVVGDIARPDDRHIAPRCIADPTLLAVENPGISLALRRREQAPRCSRAHQRLGETEAADLFP